MAMVLGFGNLRDKVTKNRDGRERVGEKQDF